VQLLVMEV